MLLKKSNNNTKFCIDVRIFLTCLITPSLYVLFSTLRAKAAAISLLLRMFRKGGYRLPSGELDCLLLHKKSEQLRKKLGYVSVVAALKNKGESIIN